jgi:hypothetical protein
MAQDVVGGRVMKIEVRQAEIQQQGLPGEFALGAAGKGRSGAGLGHHHANAHL